MRIREIKGQHRRDFTAIYECEHCGHTHEGSGYDDRHFHESVVPAMACKECGKTASETYRPLAPKYHESVTI